jgi:hypothetical protein
MAVDLPYGVALMLKRLGEGWSHAVTPGVGSRPKVVRVPGRHEIAYAQLVDSLALRLRHVDGRAAVGVWVAPAVPFAGAGRWAFDSGCRWRMCVDPDCPIAPQRHPAVIPTACLAGELEEWIHGLHDQP